MTRAPRPCLAPGCGRLTRDGRCPEHDRGPRGRNGWEWERTRQVVLDRDNYACRACGATDNLKVHHVVERQDGGPDTPENLVCLCSTCHADVHGHQGGGGGTAVDQKRTARYLVPHVAVRTGLGGSDGAARAQHETRRAPIAGPQGHIGGNVAGGAVGGPSTGSLRRSSARVDTSMSPVAPRAVIRDRPSGGIARGALFLEGAA